MKKIKIKAWAITDCGGWIKHPSVSIFDTKKEAVEGLKWLDSLPDSTYYSWPRNKIIRVEITEI
jgi:hypothetical protein